MIFIDINKVRGKTFHLNEYVDSEIIKTKFYFKKGSSKLIVENKINEKKK